LLHLGSWRTRRTRPAVSRSESTRERFDRDEHEAVEKKRKHNLLFTILLSLLNAANQG
jgi:hypothetical protein